jgi:hypothetical protein
MVRDLAAMDHNGDLTAAVCPYGAGTVFTPLQTHAKTEHCASKQCPLAKDGNQFSTIRIDKSTA